MKTILPFLFLLSFACGCRNHFDTYNDELKLTFGTIYAKAWVDGANCAIKHCNNGTPFGNAFTCPELTQDSLDFMGIVNVKIKP